MTNAVKNSEIAAAAKMAIVMDSSMVIRRACRFSAASLKMGQPPTPRPIAPIRLRRGSGSHSRKKTAAAATATTAILAASSHSSPCAGSLSHAAPSTFSSVAAFESAPTVRSLSGVCSARASCKAL